MIAVVDTGSGNLRSVQKALEHVGGKPVVTADPDVVARADRIVVPGQGAFAGCMTGLQGALGEAVLGAIRAGKPYFGICLGLQVLFEESEEQGPVRGLGVLPGRVVRFRPSDARLKVPHMGWNALRRTRPDPLLAGIAEGAHAYFVHSYRAVPADPSVTVLVSEYDGEVCAAVRKDNVFACQFHPEKSQAVGLKLLENFVEGR
jgi:imidazole glycerol-phosphate synthase subunit HisH